MANEVQILVTAQDRASAALRDVQTKAGGLGKTMGSVLKPALLGAGVAVAGLGAFLASSVKEALESQKVIAQLEAVLKSTGGTAGLTKQQLLDMAAGFQKVTTFSDEAVLGVENVLLTFTQIKGPAVQGATQAILDMSTALGTDLQSSAIQVGKALNDPRIGMTALQRVGVSFTKEQKEVIKAMTETGDIAGAQRLILKELSTEFGGSAQKAAGTFGGRMSQLKNAFGEVQEAIGMALLPILTKLAEKLATFLTEHKDDIERFTQDFVRLASEEIFPAIANAIEDVADAVGPVVEKLAPLADWFVHNKTAMTVAAIAIGAVVTTMFAVWAVSAAAAAVATIAAAAPVLALLAAVGLLAAGIFLLVKNWDKVKAAVMDSVSGFMSWLKDHWQQIVQGALLVLFPPGAGLFWIVTHFGTIKSKVLGLLDTLKANTIDKLMKLAGDAVAWVKGIPSELAKLLESFKTAGKNLAGAIADGIKSGLNTLIGYFERALNKIIGVWNSLEFKVPKVDLGPLGSIGGGTFGVPDIPLVSIPRLARGGIVLQTGLAVVERGERFSGVGAGAKRGGDIHFHFDGPILGDERTAMEFANLLIPEIRRALS